MVARVRLIVDVPFDFDINEPNETGHEPTRIDAAKYAEELANSISVLEGNVVNRLVEQVHEA